MTAGENDNWPATWTRAALEMCVLAAVDDAGTTHGYEIVRRLAAAGLGEIKGGTLYPVLARLQEQGLTTTRWVEGVGGPGRKLVQITDFGRSTRISRSAEWQRWTHLVGALVDPQPSQQHQSTTGAA